MEGSLQAIETPFVLLDYTRLRGNIRRMQALATEHAMHLRPHCKTHKCIEIAHMQIEAGAVGLTAATSEEARYFMSQGVASITLAFPMISAAQLDRLLACARRHGADLRLIVDSFAGLHALSAAARRQEYPAGVYLKVDVGLHRCGLTAGSEDIPVLTKEILADGRLKFCGLLAHAGHAYMAKVFDELRLVAQEERAILNQVRNHLSESRIDCPEISVGATPSVLACDDFSGITELRPGNYVFLDATALMLGVAQIQDVALTVLATVVSVNKHYWIIDAGSKTLSSDRGAHGSSSLQAYGWAWPLQHFGAEDYRLDIVRLSEEHGFIARSELDLSIGDRVRIIPNHACVVANLAAEYVVQGAGAAVERWPVAARGFAL